MFQVSWVRHADTHLLTVGRYADNNWLTWEGRVEGNCQVKSINLNFSLFSILHSPALNLIFYEIVIINILLLHDIWRVYYIRFDDE